MIQIFDWMNWTILLQDIDFNNVLYHVYSSMCTREVHSHYTSSQTSIMPPCDLSAHESTCPYLNSSLEIKSFVNIIWTWNMVFYNNKIIISCPLFREVFLFLAKICVKATKKNTAWVQQVQRLLSGEKNCTSYHHIMRNFFEFAKFRQ